MLFRSLPLGSEISFRFTPTFPIIDGEFGLWGLGLKHSIMQYLPGDKILPLDVTFFGAFTKLAGNTPLEVLPASYADYSAAYNSPEAFAGQEVSASVSSWNIGVLGSFSLPVVVTFYGGLGYASSRTLIEIAGDIPTPVANPSTLNVEYNDSGVLSDIDGVDIQDFSGLRANVGVRFKFAVVTIHADYTRAEYNVFSTGLGISFR